MIKEFLCWLFGHQTYNQSRTYSYKQYGEKKPFYDTICFRCGKSWRTFEK